MTRPAKLDFFQKVYWWLNKKLTGVKGGIPTDSNDGPFIVDKTKYVDGKFNQLKLNITWWTNHTTFILTLLMITLNLFTLVRGQEIVVRMEPKVEILSGIKSQMNTEVSIGEFSWTDYQNLKHTN